MDQYIAAPRLASSRLSAGLGVVLQLGMARLSRCSSQARLPAALDVTPTPAGDSARWGATRSTRGLISSFFVRKLLDRASWLCLACVSAGCAVRICPSHGSQRCWRRALFPAHRHALALGKSGPVCWLPLARPRPPATPGPPLRWSCDGEYQRRKRARRFCLAARMTTTARRQRASAEARRPA